LTNELPLSQTDGDHQQVTWKNREGRDMTLEEDCLENMIVYKRAEEL